MTTIIQISRGPLSGKAAHDKWNISSGLLQLHFYKPRELIKSSSEEANNKMSLNDAEKSKGNSFPMCFFKFYSEMKNL